jgi:hypothetical protein
MFRTAQADSTPNRSLCESMNSTSAGIGGRVPWRNKHSPPSRSRSSAAAHGSRAPTPRFASSHRSSCRAAASRQFLVLLDPVASVSGLMPSFWPTQARLPRVLPHSPHSSKTIATARSRSSEGDTFVLSRILAFPEVTASGKLGAVHSSRSAQLAGGRQRGGQVHDLPTGVQRRFAEHVRPWRGPAQIQHARPGPPNPSRARSPSRCLSRAGWSRTGCPGSCCGGRCSRSGRRC